MRIPVPHVLFAVMLCGVVTPADAMGARPPPPSSGAGVGPAGKPRPRPIQVKPDPLFPFQWVLKNNGQSLYPAPMKRGIDLNVFPVYAMGITGKGVKVMVVDDGLDTRHEDLAANIDRTMLRNLLPDAVDPNNVEPNEFGRGTHGTAMAGIIGAVAKNGVGGRGVAPGVTLGAAKLLGGESLRAPPTEVVRRAYGGAPFSRDADIFNGSYAYLPWGPNLAKFNADPEVQALAELPVMRHGKGALAIRAAGNGFLQYLTLDCDKANEAGLTCLNAEFYPVGLLPQAVMVGSVDATGERSIVSSSGANLLVAGLGGNFGFVEPGALLLGVITTDTSGCELGMSSHTPEKFFGVAPDNGDYSSETTLLSDFERPGRALFQSLNRNCNYMSNASGTSSAAATVTGVVALMLEANPNLTWRDVRTILARTSRRVDATRTSMQITLANGELYDAEPPWTRNGAGLWFHNWYGFGLVDATAAVKAARTWTRHLTGPMEDTGWLGPSSSAAQSTPHFAPVEISAGITGGGYPIRVERPGLVEFVQIRVAFDGLLRSDAAVELYSPSGTRSVLLTPHSMKSVSNTVEIVLASNAFFSERMDGDWTLRLVDASQGEADGGKSDGQPRGKTQEGPQQKPRLLDWSIRVMGS